MSTTTNDFLDALNLPSEHPYVQHQVQNNNIEARASEVKEFSIANYFSSATWKKQQSSKILLQQQEKCTAFPNPSWKDGQNLACNHDASPSVLASESPFTSRESIFDFRGETTVIDFFQEIKPCLISIFRLHILLWAPIVLLACLKRLILPPRRHNLDTYQVANSSRARAWTESSEGRNCSKYSFKKKPCVDNFLIMPVWRNIPSFSEYIPSLNTSSFSHGKYQYQQNGNSSDSDQSNIFENSLFILTLVSNAMSIMASFSAVFSIEEDRIEETTFEPYARHPMSSPLFTDEGGEGVTQLNGTKSIYKSDDKQFMIRSNGASTFNITGDSVACIIAILFSAIIMTDPMYVYEFSQDLLVGFHFLVIALSMKRVGWKFSLCVILPISVVAFYSMVNQDLNLPTIKPGLYFNNNSSFISEIINEWPVEKRTYDDGRGTPWMMTGDIRTGVPFLVNKAPTPKFIRRWIPLPEENEAVILDIAFPDNMVIEDNKTVYLVLHGINGNSNEGYVADFASRQISEGNVVAVMVTRGLMDSPVLGDGILHFARISDVSAAARALKLAIKQTTIGGTTKNAPQLVGVGYSMGAITLANFVAKSGKDCDLDMAIAFSGALDTRQQINFPRSAALWQPLIAKLMRDTLLQKFSQQINSKFNHEQVREMMEARSLVDFDRAFFVPYNGFENLEDYYSSMGAMGDFVKFDGGENTEGRIGNVSIPLCMVQALDDPVGYWGTFHDPSKVAMTGDGNTIILLTRKGGHVGWPLGMNPSIEGWHWMSDVASSFAEAVNKVNKEKTR